MRKRREKHPVKPDAPAERRAQRGRLNLVLGMAVPGERIPGRFARKEGSWKTPVQWRPRSGRHLLYSGVFDARRALYEFHSQLPRTMNTPMKIARGHSTWCGVVVKYEYVATPTKNPAPATNDVLAVSLITGASCALQCALRCLDGSFRDEPRPGAAGI